VELFNGLDSNGNGTIEREELWTVLRALDPGMFPAQSIPPALSALFDDVDQDRNGSIDIREFVEWVMSAQDPVAIVTCLGEASAAEGRALRASMP